MAFEPVFETINFNLGQKNLSEQIKVECKTEIPSDCVAGILNVGAWATVSETDVDGGKIGYGGKVIFFISYVDEQSGEIKKAECGSEFKGLINSQEDFSACKVFVTAGVEKTETDVSGVKLSVSAHIKIKAEITDCASVNALSGGENLVVNTKERAVANSLGVRHGNYPIEEEFELDYAVLEVLSHRVAPVITSVQCGIGCIIVDGEVLLSAIMLQKNDKSSIIRENRTIPFRTEIECEEAMPAMQAIARVKEKSFKTDIAVDEENLKSIVTASVVLQFEGEVFTSGVVTLATDAFSTEQEISLEREELPYFKTLDMRSFSTFTEGVVSIEELPIGASLLAVGNEAVEVVSKSCSEKGLNVTGVVTAVGFFRNGEGKAFARKLQIPFETLLECAFDCEVDFELLARAEKAKGKILTLTELSLECELLFTLYPKERCKCSLVKGVTAMGEKKVLDAGLSVYIATEGEELWSLAKRLNVCPQALVETNKDLCFPLTGEERIVVYRKK